MWCVRAFNEALFLSKLTLFPRSRNFIVNFMLRWFSNCFILWVFLFKLLFVSVLFCQVLVAVCCVFMSSSSSLALTFLFSWSLRHCKASFLLFPNFIWQSMTFLWVHSPLDPCPLHTTLYKCLSNWVVTLQTHIINSWCVNDGDLFWKQGGEVQKLFVYCDTFAYYKPLSWLKMKPCFLQLEKYFFCIVFCILQLSWFSTSVMYFWKSHCLHCTPSIPSPLLSW